MAGAPIFKVKFEGGEELLKQMQALKVNVRKSMTGATRAGMKVVQVDAEQRAKSLSTRGGKATRLVMSSQKPLHATADVGPSRRKWVLLFFEQGVTRHEIVGNPLVFEGERCLVVLGSVDHPGMAATPWLRPALEAKSDEAIRVFGEKLRAAIEEARLSAEGQDDKE